MNAKSPFRFDVAGYWEGRYQSGGTSGRGSYGRLAEFKAEIINGLIKELKPSSLIEVGCGDGNQLSLMDGVERYVGLDISATAVDVCRKRFADRPAYSFSTIDAYPAGEPFDLAMSLDVIFHLVTDDVFDAYMQRLVSHAGRHLLVYSSNFERQPKDVHVRHRRFQTWLEQHAPHLKLIRHIPNRYPRRPFLRKERSDCSFYLFENEKWSVG